MKKRFLGLICFIYSGFIIYLWIFDKIKNFLAPNMSIYIKLSLFPMIFMGLILCLNKNIKYKFKFLDLVLLLPIALFILTGDGLLTTTLASNRSINISEKKEDIEIDEEEIEEDVEIDNEEETIDEKEEADFSKVDFDVIDEAYENDIEIGNIQSVEKVVINVNNKDKNNKFNNNNSKDITIQDIVDLRKYLSEHFELDKKVINIQKR